MSRSKGVEETESGGSSRREGFEKHDVEQKNSKRKTAKEGVKEKELK